MKKMIFKQNQRLNLLQQAKPKGKIRMIFKKRKEQLATFLVLVGMVLFSPMTAFATSGTGTGGAGSGQDIWAWLQTALTDVYNKFLSVSTIAACVAASVCLIMMNFSTDDRAVSTSRAWLKRILISWVVLNVLGFIMTYMVSLTSGGRYIPSVG